MAPRREVRVYGSDPEASGSLFSTGAGTTARVDETDLVARDARRSYRSSLQEPAETERLTETSAFGSQTAVLARLDALASAVAAGAAVTGVRLPEKKSVPAEFGGAVALEGVFPAAFSSGAFLDLFGTQITCRFGSVTVAGRRIDGTSVECAAPSAKPGAKRVAVDGAAGDVALEHVARTFSLSSSSSSADAADFFGRVEQNSEDAFFSGFANPEIRGETRVVHYAGGSDVFADARGFVRFELSEPFFFRERRRGAIRVVGDDAFLRVRRRRLRARASRLLRLGDVRRAVFVFADERARRDERRDERGRHENERSFANATRFCRVPRPKSAAFRRANVLRRRDESVRVARRYIRLLDDATRVVRAALLARRLRRGAVGRRRGRGHDRGLVRPSPARRAPG
uniref:Uncharacterized protein n=1 Tax=Micromonas pusilla TaxID=38833 RepID=A0A7S0D4J2_MICPS